MKCSICNKNKAKYVYLLNSTYRYEHKHVHKCEFHIIGDVEPIEFYIREFHPGNKAGVKVVYFCSFCGLKANSLAKVKNYVLSQKLLGRLICSCCLRAIERIQNEKLN